MSNLQFPRLKETFVVCILLLSIRSINAETPSWLNDEPGLYKQVGGKWTRADWKDHRAALDGMLEHCCKHFRVPFALPAGTTIISGEDDKDLTRERTHAPGAGTYAHGPKGEEPVPGARASHCGIDVGSRVSKDGGATISTLGSASVSAVHSGGYVKVDDGQLVQRVVCEHEGLRLILDISYGHVKPAAGIGSDWIVTPSTPVGTLDGDDKWNSNDPKLTPKLDHKGNHVHLEVEGIYDKSWESEMAHNEQLNGRDVAADHADLLRRRATFFNDCLLKALTRSGHQ